MTIHNYTAEFKGESCGSHIKFNFNGFVETDKEGLEFKNLMA